MKKLFVKPAGANPVLQEDGAYFPPEGAEAENSQYIRRRIADGDLVIAPRQSNALVKAAKNQKEESK